MKKYIFLSLLISSLPAYTESSESSKFFWDDKDIDVETVKQLLTLVNKALEYKVQSDFFYLALQDICATIHAMKLEAKEKEKLLDKLQSLIALVSKKSRREVRSMTRLRRAIDSL